VQHGEVLQDRHGESIACLKLRLTGVDATTSSSGASAILSASRPTGCMPYLATSRNSLFGSPRVASTSVPENHAEGVTRPAERRLEGPKSPETKIVPGGGAGEPAGTTATPVPDVVPADSKPFSTPGRGEAQGDPSDCALSGNSL